MSKNSFYFGDEQVVVGLLDEVFGLCSYLAYLVGHLERLFNLVLALGLVAFYVVAPDEVLVKVVCP